MVGLMEVLVNKSKRQPSMLEQMFSSHPMSSERYQTAVQATRTKYAQYSGLPLNRDRYMDYTARLRRMREPILTLQEGSELMSKKQLQPAEAKFDTALRMIPHDYAGLLMMSKCQAAKNNVRKAEYYAQRATEVYPQEAQAYHSLGVARLVGDRYAAAYDSFAIYDRLLPGNPQLLFLKGLSLEGMGQNNNAAENYYRYIQQVRQGGPAQYAYGRLRQWGMVR